MAIEEILSAEVENRLVREMTENIARELAPQYTGKLVVLTGGYDHMDEDVRIVEERAGKRFLGLFPTQAERMIFKTSSIFSSDRAMIAYLTDDTAAPVVKKHLDSYAGKLPIRTVRLIKGPYVPGVCPFID